MQTKLLNCGKICSREGYYKFWSILRLVVRWPAVCAYKLAYECVYQSSSVYESTTKWLPNNSKRYNLKLRRYNLLISSLSLRSKLKLLDINFTRKIASYPVLRGISCLQCSANSLRNLSTSIHFIPFGRILVFHFQLIAICEECFCPHFVLAAHGGWHYLVSLSVNDSHSYERYWAVAGERREKLVSWQKCSNCYSKTDKKL